MYIQMMFKYGCFFYLVNVLGQSKQLQPYLTFGTTPVYTSYYTTR